MSVVEFFTNYGDWYLLIGFTIGIVEFAKSDRSGDSIRDVLMFLACCLLFPTFIYHELRQKFFH